MSLPSLEKEGYEPRVESLVHIGRYLLRVPFLRNILLACLVMALLLLLSLWVSALSTHPIRVLLVAIAACMLGIVVVALFKAGRAMLAHKELHASLRHARDELETRVENRTEDLLRSNQGLQQEIAERRQVESALRSSEARFRLLIETIPNPVFFKDENGFFLGCNAAYSYTVGLPKEKIIGRCLLDLPFGSLNEMAEIDHRQDLALIQKPGIQVNEVQLLCADGAVRDYMLFKATFRNEHGKVSGLVGIMLDITARKKIEKELKESQILFDSFMRHLPGPAFIKDLQGRYIFVNRAFSQFVGMSSDDGPIGNRDEDVWDPETAAQLQANEQAVRRARSAASTMETIHMPDNRKRYLLTTRFPIFHDNHLTALGGIAIDITERTEAEHRHKQLERQLQQAQKMEALGTLAGGIAHDFNNILASIIGYSQIALIDLPSNDSPVHEYLQRVLDAGERAVSLVKQILTFSRKGDLDPQPVQVDLIVKEVLQLVRSTLPATIEIVQNIESQAVVMADPVQIHQVMMNLCANAGYAMRDKGGTLTVSLEGLNLDEAFTHRYVDLKPGSYIRLSVADTGHGIAAEHINRIFDPFFTTKPKGEGTGMGLSVVHGIIAGLKGVTTVSSTPGQGTRFDLYLPVVQQAAVPMKRPSEALPVGTERILFVDDEPFQTDMLKHMLGLLGYAVQTCNSGTAALDRFKEDPNAFDIVITDLMMPGMRGDDLAAHMLAIRPDLPVILCSGYGENIATDRTESMGIRAFALKPLSMETLAHLIRKALGATEEAA
jgi:two-component system, cell cycle sensor histidine kinase and response regulator CckA